jgi:hypothetical protein
MEAREGFSKSNANGYGYLSGIEKDLENMSNFLRSKNVSSITVLKPSGDKKEELLKQIGDMSKTNLLVYYTGHGRKDDGAWMIQNNTTECSYLSPSMLLMRSKGLIDSPFRLMMNLSFGSINNLIIISDSCYSGNFIKNFVFNTLPGLREKITILTSCSNIELSFDTSNGGVFTNALIANNTQEKYDDLKYQTPWFYEGVNTPIIPIGKNMKLTENNFQSIALHNLLDNRNCNIA